MNIYIIGDISSYDIYKVHLVSYLLHMPSHATPHEPPARRYSISECPNNITTHSRERAHSININIIYVRDEHIRECIYICLYRITSARVCRQSHDPARPECVCLCALAMTCRILRVIKPE